MFCKVLNYVATISTNAIYNFHHELHVWVHKIVRATYQAKTNISTASLIYNFWLPILGQTTT